MANSKAYLTMEYIENGVARPFRRSSQPDKLKKPPRSWPKATSKGTRVRLPGEHPLDHDHPHALSYSFSGAYSRQPSFSTHRRAKNTVFTTEKRSFEKYKAPFDPGAGKLRKIHGLGDQIESHLRSPSTVPAATSTREECQKMHPAFRTRPPGTAFLGPGTYDAEPSFGKQSLSHHRSVGEFSFGASIRPDINKDILGRSPGPAYMPSATWGSLRQSVKDVTITKGKRPPPIRPNDISPGPVYNIAHYRPKTGPSIGFSKAKRF